jgi:hypothetical protein
MNLPLKISAIIDLPPRNHEARLKSAMRDVLFERGFTKLKSTVAKLEGELAREYRDLVAREGWVA